MNILKFVKGQFSTSEKDVARKEKVIDGIVASIDSCHGIAKVIHSRAYQPWTQSNFKALVASFNKRLGSNTYATLSVEDRELIVMKVANDLGRSPASVMIKLRERGLVKVRGRSAATLRNIAKKRG